MLASGLPEIVADDEDLARFLTSSGYFNAQMVKPAAFLPSRDQETSVFRHGSEPREMLWTIGFGCPAAGRTLHGAAIVKAREVRAASLEVTANEPPPRHAVIRGWPYLSEDPDLQKAQQKEMAISIASKAVLLRRV